jgi:superfamily I DNA and/or RNA helicase
MFYQKEQLEPVPLRHQTDTSLHYELPSEDEVDDMLKQERVIFIEVHEAYKPNMPNMPYAPLSDKANPKEARIVADLLRRIYRFYGSCFDADKTVGVIVPYRNQITMIRQEIEKLGIQELENISIDTVERYQGSQRDVIVYSFTVSRPYQLDFLTSNCFVEDHCVIDRKLNVAITRARKQLIMTGNKEILCQNSIFRQLIARYQKKII